MDRGVLLLAALAVAFGIVSHAVGGAMDWQVRGGNALPVALPAAGEDAIAAEVDVSSYSKAARSFHAELRAVLSADGSRHLTYEALVAAGAVPGTVTPPKAFGTNVALGEAVPEPSAAGLFLIGAALLALRRGDGGRQEACRG